MIQTNYFNIYNASAGTGKTFSLVRDYLVLLFNSRNNELYKNILAITFTNKAVNEMKGRIVKYLINYSNCVDLDKKMIIEIEKKTGLSEKEIFDKSSLILKNLLKNYGSFEISTIDKFTQKIIRNFTYELGIDSKYEVELDHNEIITKAIDNLISKVELNDLKSENLIEFSIEKTRNDKSWDITTDLENIAELIFNENNFVEIDDLKDYNLEDFEKCKVGIKTTIVELYDESRKLANSALSIIDKNEIAYTSFSRKTIPNHFSKISKGDFKNIYKNQIENNLIDGNLYSAKISEKEKLSIERIRPELFKIYKACKEIVYKIKLYENVLNNISPLSILSEIKKEIETLKKDENFLLISEFNKIVNEQIQNQPAPFIYEKIGTKFSHFFIDEFQDTSKMQWENLKPLIENSLASENSSLTIAGDPKQSIYRWRGGDVKEFINLLSTESPFSCEKNNIPLRDNHRSNKAIVSFSDSLFKYISEIFSHNSKLKEILNFPKQISINKEKGFLNLTFYNRENEIELDEFYNIQTFSTIEDLISRGYNYKDICIIVRKKKEGVKIGDFLSENKIPIISSEVLNLSSSLEVNFIINLIQFHIDNSDFNKINFCKSLYELNFIDIAKEDFLLEIIDKDFEEIKRYIRIDDFNFNQKMLNKISIYEAVEYIVEKFEIMQESNSYVQFFLDFVLEYSSKFQTGFTEFIEYFDEKKEKLNVINPQGIDAVEIITIHKSKGLEFPIVIYPYADINVYEDINPKAWINFDNEEKFNLKKSLVNINQDLEKINSELYKNYKWDLEVDHINLLYVVLTRAEKELYIFSDKNLDGKGNEKINFYSGIFISFLKKINRWNESESSYDFGVKQINKNDGELAENLTQKLFVVNSRMKHNILINSKNTDSWINDFSHSQDEGNIFHEIMEQVNSKKDIQSVVEKFYELGIIDFEGKREYEKIIFKIIDHAELKKYYNDELVCYNEREIISKKGFVLVPDRLVFLNNKDVVIIDYKTGKENSSHEVQMRKYQALLEEMNLKVVEKILIYVNEKIKISKCK